MTSECTKPAAKKAPRKQAAKKADTGPKTVSRRIAVDRIERDPNQPRKLFDEAKLNELAASMKTLGQLQPITVREIAPRQYQIVMGERRWRAAKIAGLTHMNTMVLQGVADGDPQTLAKAIAENVGRADMTPMEESEGFQRLADADYSIDQIAEMVGKSPAYVGWRIDLLRLALPAQEALAKGHLPVGLAWEIAQLSSDNQHRFLGRWTRGEFASTRDAVALAKAAAAAEQQHAQQGGGFFVLADRTTEARAVTGSTDTGTSPMFAGLDMGDEERQRIATDRKTLTRKIDRLGDAGAILSELATIDPEELALLLAGAPGGLGAYRHRIDAIRDAAAKAVSNLRTAQALASVRSAAIEIAPEAAAEAAPEAAAEAAAS